MVMIKGRIDLNADLGEGCGDDAAIMEIVTRCNIACGGHAGDEVSMAEALALAKAMGVVAGAHPSYPDRENFGRTQMEMSAAALRDALRQQISLLINIAEAEGITLAHVKPHGTLYNFAAKHRLSAEVIAEVTRALLPDGALMGPPNSELQNAAEFIGIPFIGEAFADRAYERDGSLRARSQPNALITHVEGCATQALQIAKENAVTSHTGQTVPLAAKTICLHSDTPGALSSARAVRDALEREGFQVTANV